MVTIEFELTQDDVELIIESLNYTRQKFENYTQYPSYEYKLQQIRRVDEVRAMLRKARNAAKDIAK